MARSSSTSRKTARASNMSNLKQGTLSFASAKRTRSTSNVKSQRIPVTENGKYKRLATQVESQDDETPPGTSEEEDTDTIEITAPVKRTRANTKARSEIKKQEPPRPCVSEKEKSFSDRREHLDVGDKVGRYRRYYQHVRSKTEHMEPIHSEGQNRIHQMLRFFDMSYEFGPCIGMTRLERWERAEAFHLDPPVEVRDILLTKEGIEKPEYAQCVFYEEV